MMISRQLKRWLWVFVFMSTFSLVQVPISQYAFGRMEDNGYKQVWLQNEPAASVNEVYSNLFLPQEQYNAITEINPNAGADPSEENKQKTGIPDQSPQKIVYLTIDDGPGPVSEQILNTLAHYKVKATFFMLEPRVYAYPNIVKRMVEEGHELGLHGVTHHVKRFYASISSPFKEFDNTRAAIREVTGKETFLARTPYGSYPYLNRDQDRAAAEEGYRIWDWNVDSRDWYYSSSKYVQHTIDQVEAASADGAEAVILIHELKRTAEYLPQLIEYLIENGYEFKTLDMEMKPIRLRYWN